MAQQDPNPAATQPDTTGASGFATAQSGGTQYVASDADSGGTEIGGSGTRLPTNDFPGVSGGGEPETTGAVGGISGTVTDTGLTGTTDTTRGGGGIGSSADPAYQAPTATPAASNVDTSRTDYPVSSGNSLPGSGGPSQTSTKDTSAWGGPVVGSTATGVPSAPTIGTAVRRAYGALVNWTPGASATGAPTRGYKVYASSGRSQIFAANVSNGVMQYMDPDVEVTFKVSAVNDNGESAKSSASNAVKPYNPGVTYPSGQGLHVPGAPTIGNASAVGSGKATVAFTAPADDGGADVTSFTAVSTPGSITNSGTSSPVTVSNLTASTVYTFKVKAHNSAGDSALSNSSNSVTAS